MGISLSSEVNVKKGQFSHPGFWEFSFFFGLVLAVYLMLYNCLQETVNFISLNHQYILVEFFVYRVIRLLLFLGILFRFIHPYKISNRWP